MNYLMCSVGRRGDDLKASFAVERKIVFAEDDAVDVIVTT